MLVPIHQKEVLIQAFQRSLLEGASYARINQARKQAEEVLGEKIEPGTPLTKVVDEAMEAAIVRVAPLIVAQADTTHQAYELLVDLLNRQPILGVRSSTSIQQQAYSTPIPIAYLTSTLAGITPESIVYEPTVGNGALVFMADPVNVIANEINEDRLAEVAHRGFRQLTQFDATEYRPDIPVDAVITNPPFGTRQAAPGRSAWFEVPGNSRGTNQLDHAIAMKALECLKDDGQAVLILGGKPGKNPEWRSDRYNSILTRGFYYALYHQYNVTDHFTIWGDLYKKQGAGFPIDVVVINGQGESQRALPAVNIPRIYTSFEDLKELIPNVVLDHSRILPSIALNLESLTSARNGTTPGSIPISGANDAVTVPIVDADPDRVLDRELDDLNSTDSAGDTQPIGTEPGTGLDAGTPTGTRRPLELGNGLGRSMESERTTLPEAAADRNPLADADSAPGSRGGTNPTNFARPDEPRRMANGIDPGDMVMADTQPSTEELLVPYISGSRGVRLNTLTPSNLAVPTQVALQRLQNAVGDVDEFVRQRLGFDTVEEMWGEKGKRLCAEQIDAIAMGMWQRDRGKVFLNADQTGNGKGRWCAAQVLDAVKQGGTAVWVTQQKDLYAAAVGDLTDIGAANLKIFATDNNLRLELPNGQVLKPASVKDQEAEMQRILNGEIHYDLILTTYSQMQTVAGKEPFRRTFFRDMAPQLTFVFDEAHNAGGQTGAAVAKDTARSHFVRGLVRTAKGAVFATATAVKDPAVLDLYALRSDAADVVSVDLLQNALLNGGVPLQQMIAAKFVESGQMLRRERSYEGVNVRVETLSVDREAADQLYRCMGAISRFDLEKEESVQRMKEALKAEAKAIRDDSATGDVGARSTNFTSLMHNFVEQSLLGLKAQRISELAISAHQQGQKPVVACVSTMESHLQRYVEENGLRPGDEINITFADLLRHNLVRSRDVITADHEGKREKRPLTDEELGASGVTAYEEAMELINSIDVSNIPISFLDHTQKQLEQSGVRTGEITGRSVQVDYDDNGRATFEVRPDSERNTQAKVSTVNGFNSGYLDGLTINAAGFTGISIHASERFADQKERHLITGQVHSDINQVIQLYGRVHRFGQVRTPEITIAISDLPAERRIAALLADRMKRLNANTTANDKSSLSFVGASQFFSEYGEAAINHILDEYPEFNEKLAFPREYGTGDTDLELIKRVTGRMPLMSIAEQEELYELIDAEVAALVEQDQLMGRNPLAAGQLELDAKTVARVELVPPTKLGNAFGGAVYAEVVDAKAPVQVMSQLEAINTIRESLQMPAVRQIQEHNFTEVDRIAREKARAQIQEIRQTAKDYKAHLESSLEGRDQKAALTRLEKQGTHILNTVNTFPPGTPVEMKLPDGKVFYGVVQEVIQSKQKGNPLAPSNWQANVLAQDYARVFPIRLSNFNTGAKGHEIAVVPAEITGFGDSVYETFDQKQGRLREERVILRGNLLSAFEKYPGGDFAYYTTDKGERLSGLVMPRHYDREALQETLEDFKPQFHSAETIKEFLAAAPGEAVVGTEAGSLELKGYKRNEDKFILNAFPLSGGGRFFRNEELIDLIGQDFFEVGTTMRAQVPAERLDGVLHWLVLNSKVVALEQVEVALEVLGQRRPELEWLEAEAEALSDAEVGGAISDEFGTQQDTEQIQTEAKSLLNQAATQLQEGSESLESFVQTVEHLVAILRSIPSEERNTDIAQLAQQSEALIEQAMFLVDETETPDVWRDSIASVKTTLEGVQTRHLEPPVTDEGLAAEEPVTEQTVPYLRVQPAPERLNVDGVNFRFSDEQRIGITQAVSQTRDIVELSERFGQILSSEVEPEELLPMTTAIVQFYQEQGIEFPSVIAPTDWQPTIAAELAAQAINDSGLIDVLLAGDSFSMQANNYPYPPLMLAREGNELLMSFHQEREGEVLIDESVKFKIDTLGRLNLEEAFLLDPNQGNAWNMARDLRDEEDKASIICSNLLEHKYADALKNAWELAQQTVQGSVFEAVEVETPIAQEVSEINSESAATPAPVEEETVRLKITSLQSGETTYLDVPANPIPQPQATAPEENSTILPPKEQFGRAEKSIAHFLEKAQLSEVIFNAPDQDFHLHIENAPYLPLVVERHDDSLYFTHYRQDDFDGSVMGGEMVFKVFDTGHLKLAETAVQNPFNGGKSRGLDKSFGALFARNIIDQGFVEAAQEAMQKEVELAATAKDAEFWTALHQECDRIAPQAKKWLLDHPDEPISEFLEHYPEKERCDLPPEFRLLAVQSINEAMISREVGLTELTPIESQTSSPEVDKLVSDLQEKYPGYSITVGPSDVNGRDNHSMLIIQDPDKDHVFLIDVHFVGERLAFQEATEALQRHEQIRQQPELIALRDEFPDLRFTNTQAEFGLIVTAYDRDTDHRMRSGVVRDHKGVTSEQFEGFREQLRELGYSVPVDLAQESTVQVPRSLDAAIVSQTPEEQDKTASGAPGELAVSVNELQSKYPDYCITMERIGIGSNLKPTMLSVQDADQHYVFYTNVSESGERIASQEADQKIQQHQEKLNLPQYTSLREEFPTLSFQIGESTIGIGTVVTAYEKGSRDRVAIAVFQNEDRVTPPEFEKTFKQELREQGYSIFFEQSQEPTPEDLRSLELRNAEDILRIAEAGFAFAEANGEVHFDGEFWSYAGDTHTISYNPDNANFFVLGQGYNGMCAQSIDGRLDSDCIEGISASDVEIFENWKSHLIKEGWSVEQSPQETVELAQSKLAQANPLHSSVELTVLEGGKQTEPEPAKLTLNDLRMWYRHARDVGRSDNHLKKIEQTGKAFAQSGTPLNERDLKVMAKDQKAWQLQAIAIAEQTKLILSQSGERTKDGNGVFYVGNEYTLFSQADMTYALASGRGVCPSDSDQKVLPSELVRSGRGIILKVEHETPDPHATRVTSADAQRFEECVLKIEQHQEQPHAVGYER